MALKKLRTMMMTQEVQTNLTVEELRGNTTIWQEALDFYLERAVGDEGGKITISQKPKVQVAQAPKE